MASEFHQFVNLPTELRLKIWKYALRPIISSRPGVHFFSVTNYKEDGDQLTKLRVQCDLGSKCKDEHGYCYCLAAPKFISGESNSHSWTSNNPSSYLWDFGMWSACNEAKEIIGKHYKTEYWATKLLQGYDSRSFSEPDIDACVPFIFPRSEEDWRFAIHPNRDLVCLQPLNPSTIGLYGEYKYIDLMDDICMVSRNTGLRGLRNLAFEYDSSWCDNLETFSGWPSDAYAFIEEKGPRGFFMRTLMSMDWLVSLYVHDSIWLIDYSLKRDGNGGDHAHTKAGNHMTFYANDRKFVEVDKSSVREYLSAYSGSALEFVDQLNAIFCGFTPEHVFYHYTYGLSWHRCDMCEEDQVRSYRSVDKIRILACEEND
ncbi:hypothetical protein ACHAQJ_002366 [Trichoderma viride]